jgi:surfeit locus 1 family protein
MSTSSTFIGTNYRRVFLLALTLSAAALTARLGFWQLDRAEQKLALQEQIDSRGRLPPLGETELAQSAEQAQAQHQRAATVRGQWLPQHTVYLENRQMRGQPGFFVLTPLLLEDGSALVVQRGWQPRDLRDRTLVEPVPTPASAVRVQGRIAPPPSRLLEFDAAASGPLRQNLDLAAYALETGLRLRPMSLLQTGTVEPPDGLLREWLLPQTGVAKHHGYAVQWFALSALVISLYVWFQILAPRRRAAAR